MEEPTLSGGLHAIQAHAGDDIAYHFAVSVDEEGGDVLVGIIWDAEVGGDGEEFGRCVCGRYAREDGP